MQSNKQVMGLGSAVVLVKETLLEESGVQKLRAQIQTKDARIKELEEVLETSSACNKFSKCLRLTSWEPPKQRKCRRIQLPQK